MGRLFAWLCVVACLSGLLAPRSSGHAPSPRSRTAVAARVPRCRHYGWDLAISVSAAKWQQGLRLTHEPYPDYKSDPANFYRDRRFQSSAPLSDEAVASPGSRTARASFQSSRTAEWLEEVSAEHQDERQSARRTVRRNSTRTRGGLRGEQREADALSCRRLTTSASKHKDLRKLAVDNLARILPKIEMQGDDRFRHAHGRRGLRREPSAVRRHLAAAGRSRWRETSLWRCPPRMCCWSPARRTAKASPPCETLAAKFMSENRYRLTDALFVYRDGRFTRFGRK